ncbi:MAG TPA: hypothetical protein VKZ18_04085 [Polyangia bacterium]|nr:hypothetical protein [Polyangia bacterium]
MRLNRSILFAIMTTAATTGAAFAQTDAENPPSAPPGTEVQPTPETMAPPEATPPPPEATPAPMAPPTAVPVYPDHNADVLVPEAQGRWMPMSRIGVGAFVGGGVTDFTGGTARNQTNTGGSWTARVTAGTRSIVGVEGSYIGGANTIHGLGGNADLVRNGIEGVLRLNLPLYARDTLLEPYIFGGAGWNGYRVTNFSSLSTASFTSGTDNTLSVPLGVGFTVGYHGFLADLRYTIRPTYDQSTLVNASGTGLTNWDAGGMIGYEF